MITLGIEEEFFLVDPESRDLLADPDVRIFESCDAQRGPHKIVRELLRTQIETNSRVCDSVAEVRAALLETRQIVVRAAEAYGASVMAASTHPFADWRSQAATPRERYERFTVTYQDSVRRFLIGGMHVHAGFGDPDSRIRVMTAVRRYLPILHALSATSPFIEGHETGFKSYRLNLLGNLPRTSLPGPLRSRADFDRLVADYQRMDFITDGSGTVVGYPSLPQVSDHRIAHLRHLHACRRCHVHRGALRVPHPLAAPPGPGRRAAA